MILWFDQYLFQLINQKLTHPFLDVFMPWITVIHHYWWVNMVVIPFIILFAIWQKGKTAKAVLHFAIVFSLADAINFRFIKPFFARARPEFSGIEVDLKTLAHYGYSFPSNHAVNAFAVAMILALLVPRGKWWFFLLAALVGYSRVYVGVHYPLDVIGGAVIGIFLTKMYWKIISRISFFKLVMLFYNIFFWTAVKCMFSFASIFSPSWREHIRDRKLANLRIKKWRSSIPQENNIWWFHVSSAGEFLQAKPIIDEMKASKKNITCFLTYFSPSAKNYVEKFQSADYQDYLYSDEEKNIRELIQILKPQMIFVAKNDIWPNLILLADTMNIPTVYVAATLTESSWRQKLFLGRWFYQHLYRKMRWIFSVSENGKANFETGKNNVWVTGDTRLDASLEIRDKILQKKEQPPYYEPLIIEPRKKWVIGSSWPKDEKIVLATLKKLKIEKIPLLLVLAPHDVSQKHLERIEKKLQRYHFAFIRLSEMKNNSDLQNIDVVLVDQIGHLMTLYQFGNLAYVGAGRGGLHNILEPSVWSLPIIFGRRYFNSPEAIELLDRGGAFSITQAELCFQKVKLLLKNSSQLQKVQNEIRQYVGLNQNVTGKILKKIGVS